MLFPTPPTWKSQRFVNAAYFTPELLKGAKIMALAHVNYYSHVLGQDCQAEVVLPQKRMETDPDPLRRGGELPVLWLLHGGTEDNTAWQRQTSIERYATDAGIAVVMPSAQLSFYSNMASGGRYLDFIAEELPKTMRGFFHFSDKRENNFVAGSSMGGYGAFKLALTKPEKYAAAASLSGSLDLAAMAQQMSADPRAKKVIELALGDIDKLKDSEHDILFLLKKAKKEGTNIPKLFVCCGTDDFIYSQSVTFRELAKRIGVEITYHEEPGAHEWEFWNRNIQNVLKWLPFSNKSEN
jgi:S-formylglutathione hydrolase FrmB